MSKKALLGVCSLAIIAIALGGVLVFGFGTKATYEECQSFKREFESDTNNRAVQERLDAQCSGWESDY